MPLSVPEVYASARAAFCWQRASNLARALERMGWQSGSQDYVDLINQAEQASSWCPQNVTYRYYLNAYRWRGVQQFVEPASENYPLFVSRIVDELQRAGRLCPTYGPPHYLAGQLEFLVLDQPEGADEIRTGYRLAPNDEQACLAAGRLENRLGHPDEALKPFRGAIRRNPAVLPEVIGAFLFQMQRPDLAVAAAEQDANALLPLADQLERGEQDVLEPNPRLAGVARTRALTLLKAHCEDPGAQADVLAQTAFVCERQGDAASAIEYYRRALNLDRSQVGWRMRRARLLLAAGRTEAAMKEARACMQIQPGQPDALRLMMEIDKLGGAETPKTRLPQ